jgi:hypothetical protein
VVALAAAAAGGVLVGRSTGDASDARALPTPPTAVTPADPATRYASTADPGTGARLTVAVIPAEGWVRINAAVSGIPRGEPCRLLIVGRDGTTALGGSWLVSADGAVNGTTLDGSALVDPAQVAGVRVENAAGKVYVSATW